MKNKSFTLIELLVVIAIIGLLASIVLVSMGGLQSKAKITKILEFSQSLQRNLGAYAVGVWSFDDQTNPTQDGSGYKNNSTVYGAVFTSDTPHAAIDKGTGKYALSFNGINNYAQANSAGYDLEKSFTIEAWIKIDTYPDTGSPGIGQVGYNKEVSIKPNGKVGCGSRAAGPPFLEFESQEVISTLTWYHIACSFLQNGVNMVGRIFINGKLDSSNTVVNTPFNTKGNPIRIGTQIHDFGDYFDGAIDEVKIYEQALSLSEIQRHYAEGLDRHKNLAIK